MLMYLLKVSAGLVLFFAFYILFLRKLTFFRFNRMYLLLTLLLSFLIPTFNFTVERTVIVEQPAFQQDEFIVPAAQEIAVAPVDSNVQLIPAQSSFNWLTALPYIYFTLAIFTLSLALWRLTELIRYTKHGIKLANGLRLVAKDNGFTNCSFFNYVFVDQINLKPAELEVLLTHESVHANRLHSLDKLLMMLAKSVLWFNPVVYLWERSMEQVHEYEADELTSSTFGTHSYASLLLHLAVENKAQSALVHNFVKSPIKDRIKMLFNLKSNNMKKVIYLLVLPVVLVLVLGFTVNVVEIPAVSKDNNDPVIGQKLEGVVDSITVKSKFAELIHFKANGQTFIIEKFPFIKVNRGDKLIIVINGKRNTIKFKDDKNLIFETPMYTMSQAYNAKGDSLIMRPKVEKHAFLYEGNKARYAISKISKIEKNSSGYVNKIYLNDGTFTLIFNISELKTKAANFKIGDEAEVKFIGEKLISNHTYLSSKLIAMYSVPKNHELINKNLYSRFYSSEGFQKENGKDFEPKIDQLASKVRIVSFAKKKLFPKRGITDLEDAVIMVNGVKMEAKSIRLFKEGGISATDAAVYLPDGNTKKYRLLMYNTSQNTFSGYEYAVAKERKLESAICGPGHEGKLELSPEILTYKIPYYALDSVKVNKILNNVLLSGKAKIKLEKYDMQGKVIFLDHTNNLVTVYYGTLKEADKFKIDAEVIEVDLANKTYKTKNYLK